LTPLRAGLGASGLVVLNPDGTHLVIVPSVVSRHSWNLLVNAATAAGLFGFRSDERFALEIHD
jgi:hypothetical protein